MKVINILLVTSVCTLVLSGCMSTRHVLGKDDIDYEKASGGGRYTILQDHAPTGDIKVDHLPDLVPKWEQKSQVVPHKITSIDKKSFQFQNPQTAADLLSASGEVFVQKSQQGGGSPMIRGFATNRLLYAVDGVRMNTAIFRSGNIQNVISF